MEIGVAGFKIRGSWADIVQHGDRITKALVDLGAATDGEGRADAFRRWDRWRPKIGEGVDPEMRTKTAQAASVSRGPGERAGRSPGEDIRSAGRRLGDAVRDMGDDDLSETADQVGTSMDRAVRAADSAGRKTFRALEEMLYERVMTRLAPLYFDSELISANLQRTRDNGEQAFVFEVNINDDEVKEAVARWLAENEPDDGAPSEQAPGHRGQTAADGAPSG